VVALEVAFWVSLALLAWTHVLYPIFAALLARVAPRAVRKGEIVPTVAMIIAAYNEETVIARRIENLLALDYPSDKLQIVVTSDASSDRTEEIAAAYPGVKVISNPRGGKVAAQDRAVRETTGDVVAFSDANATWSEDALRKLVRGFADPDVGYVCGQLKILAADGSNKEGVYWRYEMLQRAAESTLGSVTGGNGSIYAVRRVDYVEVDPRFGHDLSLPYLMVQRGAPCTKPTRTHGRSRHRQMRPSTGARCACSSTAG
jgi:cellulose synthase/poly-beta-1,6-N-acetylglucosamine synthase-like glycosyltransferase